jgi:HPt (histidine-containing phosphotransfer) domain-containing protein
MDSTNQNQVVETPRVAIDREFLRGIIDNDREFEKELFAIFAENAQRNIVKMEEAVRDENNNSWYMAAHAFKGAAASIGAFDLSKILEHAQKNPEADSVPKTKLISDVKDEMVLEFIKSELS